jgi:hypothetical protein
LQLLLQAEEAQQLALEEVSEQRAELFRLEAEASDS